MRNNSDARKAAILDDVSSAQARHNGGKLVIVTLDRDDVEAAKEILDGSHSVDRYEITQ